MAKTRDVKSKRLKVITVCSECGEPVCATSTDHAYRHGFKRYKTVMATKRRRFSQEDGTPCRGSGQPVKYSRRSKK